MGRTLGPRGSPSKGIGPVSSYQQMQNWRSSQGAINSKIFGKPAAIDGHGAVLASINSVMYAAQASLAGQAALARVQKKVIAALGAPAPPAAAVARARGQAILSSL